MIETLNDSIVAKIKKLLELSTSDNPHESELALLHAKRLAAQHDVDITLIEIFGKSGKTEPIVKNEGINLGNRKSITQKYVSWILQDHFGVKVVYCGSRQRGMNLVLIGRKDKIAIAEYVQHFLNREFLSLWRAYYSNSGCPLTARDSYLTGLHRGLAAKLAKEQTDVENEKLGAQTAEVKNSFALMVISEKDKLEKVAGEFYPKLKTVKTFFRGDFSESAMITGSLDGAKINLNRSISNGSANGQLVA
jgi:hypothetical protein